MDNVALVRKMKSAGKSKGKADADSNYDARELAMGTKVEMEHGLGKAAAREIAKDHLAENPHYYSKVLIPAEKKADVKKATSYRIDLLKREGLIRRARFIGR